MGESETWAGSAAVTRIMKIVKCRNSLFSLESGEVPGDRILSSDLTPHGKITLIVSIGH